MWDGLKMDELGRLLIERACERLVHRYARLIDAYDYAAFMDLWAGDATWVMLGNAMTGTDAIRAGLEARDPTMICRHMVTNILIDVEDADHASGHCYTISFHVSGARGHEPGPLQSPTFFVEYRDRFIRHPDRGWLFARRDITAPLVRDLPPVDAR
jgi:ketosteroid isomerase-like protein